MAKADKYTYYDALVDGKAWSGDKAFTSYRFESEPTYEQVKARAGDFETVRQITVVQVVTRSEMIKRYIGDDPKPRAV